MKKSYIFKLIILAIVLPGLNLGVSGQTITFNYTGAVQTYTVPACITSVMIDAQGGKGGRGMWSRGGFGARVQCTLAVTAGEVLNIYVGGNGDTAVYPTPTVGGVGGYNGGASGAVYLSGHDAGGGGGGGSDIRIAPYAPGNRIVVAGGGGGAGFDYYTIDYDRGGDGGGTTGENGWHHDTLSSPAAGKGGTPGSGGLGGVYAGYTGGSTGSATSGGNAGSGTAGGGGGGGWYSGGGGSWGGGGGGSSYTDPLSVTAVTHTRGYDSIQGIVMITPVCNAGAISASAFSVCAGGTIALSNPTGMTCGTSWSSGSPSVASIDPTTGGVTGISAGTATITYNLTAACGSVAATQTITVNPAPGAISSGGASTVCTSGGTLALTDPTPFGGWSSSSPANATVAASTGVVTGVSAGLAVITYSLTTSCFVTLPILAVACPAGVNQTTIADKYKVEIFPNPVNSELTVKMQSGAYNAYTIVNSIGQVFMQQQLTAAETKLNVKNLPTGIYYLTLRGEKGTLTKRFVKME